MCLQCLQVDVRVESGMDDAFVNETAEHGTPKPGDAGDNASCLIQSDGSDTDEGPDTEGAFPTPFTTKAFNAASPASSDATSEATASPATCVEEDGDEISKPDGNPVIKEMLKPGATSGPVKGSVQAPPPPAWAAQSTAEQDKNGNGTHHNIPRAYGERAEGAPFVLAEHALRAAEEVRLAGNDAFFAGQFEKAQELYRTAGRHLESASALEGPTDLAIPGYIARKLECTEKSKLNLAACRIKVLS